MRDIAVVGGIFREIHEYIRDDSRVRVAGSGLTSALVAARLGARVSLISYVGDEDAPIAFDLLSDAGVGTDHVAVLPGSSGIFVFGNDHDEESPRPLYRPAEGVPVTLAEFEPHRILLIFGIPDYDPVRDPSVRAAANCQTVVIWDRQGWLSRTRDATPVAGIDAALRVYVGNLAEASAEGVVDIASGNVRLPDGFEIGLIKNGMNGSVVVQGNPDGVSVTGVPAFPLATPIGIGSGDVFAGAYAALVARGSDIVVAATRAAAAVAVVLATRGGIVPGDLDWQLEHWEGTAQFAWPWPLE